MNWIKKSVDILGNAWCDLLKLGGLVDGIRACFGVLGNTIESRQDKWEYDTLHVSDNHKYATSLPFPVYFLKTSAAIKDGILLKSDEVGNKARPIEDIFSGAYKLGDETPGVFILQPAGTYPSSFRLTSSVLDPEISLIHGIDYEIDDKAYIFYTDPGELGLREITLADDNGGSSVYYKMFGWPRGNSAKSEIVRAIAGDSLITYADTVWDMHINGATISNAKDLLCGISGAVVSKASGTVSDIWHEQGRPCVAVDGVVHLGRAGQVCNFSPGTSVVSGDVLFGDIYEWHGGELPDNSELHGMLVRTDVGELYAKNSDLDVVEHVYNGKSYTMLPLTTPPGAPDDSELITKYFDRCCELISNGETGPIQLPDTGTINPCAFILGALRYGRSSMFMITPVDFQAVLPAITCIRKSTSVGGMVSIYIKADCDEAGLVLSGFLSDAGNMAVAEDVTITIQDTLTEIGAIR